VEGLQEAAELAVAGLAALVEECGHARGSFGIAEADAEELVFGEQPFGRVGQRRVYGLLGARDRAGGERRDARGEGVDERAQLLRGERPVHIAPVCGGLRVDVAASERDLECASSADETGEPLCPAAVGNDADRDLRLGEYRPADRREPHVERERELAPAAARDAFDDRDGRFRHRAEAIDHGLEPTRLRVARRVVGGERLDQRDVGVGGEELGIGGVEDHDPNGLVGLDVLTEAGEVDDEPEVEEVDRRMVDCRPGDALVDADAERLIVVVGHGGKCRGARPMLDGARIFHVNINCSDLTRSRAFYVDGCGLAEGVRTTPETTQSGTAFGLDRARWDAWILVGAAGFDGGAVDLLEWQEPPPIAAPPAVLCEAGWQRIGLLVPDLDAAIANACARGGVVWSEPLVHELPNGGGVRLVLMSDPDGVAVELVEGDTNRLSFVGLTCSDLERSVAFYRALGFRELARFPSARDSAPHLRVDGPVSMLEVLMRAPGPGDVHLMLVGFDEPAVARGAPRAANALGMWRTALLLPELEPAVAALRAAEVELISEPRSMAMGPGLPELQFVCFRGPDHEVIELIEQPA
jgi:glyoxylase I family protein